MGRRGAGSRTHVLISGRRARGRVEGQGRGFLPRRSSSWAQTVLYTDLLIDDIYAAEAEGRDGRAQPRERTSRPPPAREPGSASGSLSVPPSPVEAGLVETLLAGPVYGVEAGARVLLLTAVWVTGGGQRAAAPWLRAGGRSSRTPGGDWPRARNPCTLRLDTHTHTETHTPTHAHSTAGPPQAARF